MNNRNNKEIIKLFNVSCVSYFNNSKSNILAGEGRVKHV